MVNLLLVCMKKLEACECREGRSIGCGRDKSAPTVWRTHIVKCMEDHDVGNPDGSVRFVWLSRQGSKELDSSSSTERSSPVIPRCAKDLVADRDRPFASLRVT